VEAEKQKKLRRKTAEKFCLETKENKSMKNSFLSEDYVASAAIPALLPGEQ
jgi:hypothetical protein